MSAVFSSLHAVAATDSLVTDIRLLPAADVSKFVNWDPPLRNQ